MNLDQLSSAIAAASDDPAVVGLSALLCQWKNDDSDVEHLERLVERYIGNIWVGENSVHQTIFHLWSKFREEAIRPIRGMTINERLFCFSLFERFDDAQSAAQRHAIYEKLLAKR